jgi:hypothetical protein
MGFTAVGLPLANSRGTSATAAAWSARVSDGRLVTERAPDGPSGTAVVVTGTAQDIALLVWKRGGRPGPNWT